MRSIQNTLFPTILAAAFAAVSACSAHPDATTAPVSGAASGNSQQANATGDDADTITQIDCAKIFTSDDTTPILGKPAKVSNYPARDRSCYFESADGQTITVYGGKGDDITSKAAWNDVTKSSDANHFAKLAGVGDEAYWRNDGLGNEIPSRKGDLWCTVAGGVPAHSEAEARKAGELCNKMYASGL